MVKEQRSLRLLMFGMLALMGLIALVNTTASGVLGDTNITNLPGGVATGLGISTLAAQLLVCGAGILSATLVMTATRTPFAVQLLADLIITAFFTVMGWLDSGVFIALLLLIAILFAGTFIPRIWGGYGG
jgi:hypothetical protein